MAEHAHEGDVDLELREHMRDLGDHAGLVAVLGYERRIVAGELYAQAVDLRDQDVAAADGDAQHVRDGAIAAGDADARGVGLAHGLVGILDAHGHVAGARDLVGVLDARVVRRHAQRARDERLVRAVAAAGLRKRAVQRERRLRHVAAGDLLETAVAKAGETYDYTPENWDLNKYVDMSNVYCAVYQEELCGYMAGYAAVKLGYKNLGFLGGRSVPAVVRYGYGFVQGVDAAAADLGLTDVKVNYIYGGQFFGDADITAVMDTWYQGGTEVVFACGGGIYTSAVDAAKKVGAKVIGVDVDQAGVIAKYAGVDGMTVTSAMKGLYPATYDTLTDVIVNGNWDKYVGKIATLGLVSGTDPEANYVQIPMGDGTQWSDSFTQDDYKAMVKDMFDGKITVSNNTSSDVSAADFATVITVDDQGSIKG